MNGLFPEVSVVIPCRNEIKTIEECINSVLNQSIGKDAIEIIVVDGMSNDGTREILKSFSGKYSNVKIIDNEKKITPVALNLGIKNAKGKYVAILGAHSKYHPEYIKDGIIYFQKNEKIVCVGGPIRSIGKSNFGKAVAEAMSHPVGVGNAIHRFPDYDGYAKAACFPIFLRETFDQIGMYDESLVHDHDDELNHRLNKSGFKVYLSSNLKCDYNVRETPASLFKQFFNYGFWRGAILKKQKSFVAIRKAVPLIFWLSVIFLFFMMLFLSGSTFLALLLPAIYFSVLIFLSVEIIIKKNFITGFLFIFAVSLMHFAYAAGTFWGIIKFFSGKK